MDKNDAVALAWLRIDGRYKKPNPQTQDHQGKRQRSKQRADSSSQGVEMLR